MSNHDGEYAAVIDVGAQQLAGVYAKAYLDAAAGADKTESMVRELDWLVREVLGKHPEFERVLGSALVSHKEKEGILDRVFGDAVSRQLLAFLKVLSLRGRLNLLGDINREVHTQYNRKHGRVDVYVRSATDLSESQQSEIGQALRLMLDAEPELHISTDPSLLAGLVIRVGDTVYDGSVATRLRRAEQEMIRRSVDLIEMGREKDR